MSGMQPLCRFVLSQSHRSILDTIFVNQTPRRPAYATTTDGSLTTLWCMNRRGKMLEVAQIHWRGDQSNQGSSTVVVNGQVMLVDNVLKRSKKLFGSDSRYFTAGTTHYKWKSDRTGILSRRLTEPGQPFIQSSYNATSETWICYDTTVPPNTSSSSSATSSPPVAIFFPPQPGLVKSELTIYPNGEAIVDHIILTAILICARKDEWRSAQSNVSRNALEASLNAEIHRVLPPYNSTPTSRHRTVPASPRRPHTSSSSSRTRHPTHPPPPPYTSVDDISIPHR